MNNHYIPQFIIRLFAERPNLFDFETKTVTTGRNPKSILCEKNIYTDEVERLSAEKVDTPFAKLLHGKIQDKTEVILTRTDLDIVKHYMLVASIRGMDPEFFRSMMDSYVKKADRLLELQDDDRELFVLKGKKRLKDIELDDKDLYMKAMTLCCRYGSLLELAKDEEVFLELYAWALPYWQSYFAIWDAPENKSFVLTDCPMNTEYEGFHHLTGGYDVSKIAYLTWSIKHSESKADTYGYFNYLRAMSTMYENFDFFSISKKRVMVAVNPFFRLYTKNTMRFGPNGGEMTLKEPDIWPTVMGKKEYFDTPTNVYVLEGSRTPNDEFHYKSSTITEDEVDYLNFLMLGSAKRYLAFDDGKDILGSILMTTWGQATIQAFQEAESQDQTFWLFWDKLINSKYEALTTFIGKPDNAEAEKAVKTFESLTNALLQDSRTNPYLAWYTLRNEEALKNDNAFGFLGTLEQRKAHFEKMAKPLLDKELNTDSQK